MGRRQSQGTLQQDAVTTSLKKLLSDTSNKSPDVARKLAEKWQEDHRLFTEAVRAETAGRPAETFGNSNCKKPGCYGRGYIGINAETKEKVLCACASKGYRTWLQDFRKEFNSERDGVADGGKTSTDETA